MPGSVRVFIACSLDGFIAGPSDDLSWLPGGEGGSEDYGYAAFMAGTEALLMGRRTYDVVQGVDAWPYGDTPVFVATSRALDPPQPTVTAVTGGAESCSPPCASVSPATSTWTAGPSSARSSTPAWSTS